MSPARRGQRLLPAPTTRGEDWRDRALCLGLDDPEVMFPADGDIRGQREAKAICAAGCPVVAECLADALRTGDRYAIRGGLTPRGRDKLRRRRAGATT